MPAPHSKTYRFCFILALLGCAALLAAAAVRQIWPADFWWQLKTGEYVAANGFPHTDVFSYTVHGARWIELRWLYCLFLHGLQSAVGFAGLSAASAMIVVLTWAFAVAPALRPTLAAAVILPIAILAAAQRYFLRPELFSYLFFAVFIFVLRRQEKSQRPWLYLIPLLQIAWVNLHTVFALGPAVIGLWFAILLVRAVIGRKRQDSPESRDALLRQLRRAAIVLACTLVACLVNPYGWRSFEHAAQILRMTHGSSFKEQIVELKGAFEYDASAIPIFYFRVLIAVFLLSLLANARKLDPFWTLLAASQLYLSFQSVRNIPFFCLVATPLTIDNLRDSAFLQKPAFHWIATRFELPIALAVVVFCLFFVREFGTDRFYVRHLDTNRFGLGLAAHRAPVDAERYVRELPSPDPIFSTMVESSYLLYRDHPVFYDGRLEVYGENRFDEYRRIENTGSGWADAAKRYGFNTAVVALGSRLVNIIAADPGWRLRFLDDVAAVFVRTEITTTQTGSMPAELDLAALVEPVRRKLGPPQDWNSAGLLTDVTSSVPYQQLGAFALALGAPHVAEPLLTDALRTYPGDPVARKYRGQCREALGDLHGAIADYDLALQQTPDDPDLLTQLANQYLAAALPEKARPLVTRATQLAPQDSRTWALQAALLAHDQRWPEAAQCMQKAVELDPTNNNFRTFLEVIRKNVATR